MKTKKLILEQFEYCKKMYKEHDIMEDWICALAWVLGLNGEKIIKELKK